MFKGALTVYDLRGSSTGRKSRGGWLPVQQVAASVPETKPKAHNCHPGLTL